MKFVKEHDANFRQCAVILQPAQQNAFGDVTDARAETGLVVEADLVADFLAEFAAALPRDAGRHRARGDSARLQHDDFFVVVRGEFKQPGVEEHLRHLRGFAGTGGRDQNQAVAVAQRADNVGMDLPDGKRGLRGPRKITEVRMDALLPALR